MEIERTYLLNAMPDLPAGARTVRIEQGYFADREDDVRRGAMEGRIRRAIDENGSVRCTHTIKRGSGLIHEETEREITEAEFLRHWPATAGRRLTKTRHAVAWEGFTWEVDTFDDLDLVLAEVELPAPDVYPTVPVWLAPHIARDVTDEKDYRNYELALRLAGMPGRGAGET